MSSVMLSREPVFLKIKELPHFQGVLPEYKSEDASGFDIRACLEEPLSLPPFERAIVPTGLSFEIPKGFELQVRPRSGLALKKGITLLNTPGTIDSDYRGEIKILVINLGKEEVVISNQDRIAQMVLSPVYPVRFQKQKKLSKTKRGDGGFGSTGEQ